jgi:hypothetical protein
VLTRSFGVLAVLLGSWFLYTSVWYSPRMEARVAAPDGKPIAGAIVVVTWTIEKFISGGPGAQAALAEVVTDKDGWFHIPSWGPRLVTGGWIRVDEPTVRVFKPGFIPAILQNYEGVPMRAADKIISLRLQDQTIVLQPFHGTLLEYEAALKPLVRSLDHIYSGGGVSKFCYWRETPRVLLALQDLKLKLAAFGAGGSLSLAYQYAIPGPQSPCGDAEKFFKEYSNAKTN